MIIPFKPPSRAFPLLHGW